MAAPRHANAEFIDRMEFGLHSGYRLDFIDWNIAGNLGGQDINGLSEMDWNNLEIWQVGGSGKLAVGNDVTDYHTYIRASLDYGWLTEGGRVRDSEYSSNNPRMEIFRSNSGVADNDVFDASIGLGFEKKYWQNRFVLGWLGGYSYHEQNLRTSGTIQSLSLNAPINVLDSTYENKWYGPFAGIDLELHPHPRFSLLGTAEYHWADYEGQADWNLRNDLAHPLSFENQADSADGLVGTLTGRYLFTNGWTIDLSFNYRNFSATDGVARTFFANGDATNNKLNEVKWKSYATSLGLTRKF